MAESKAITNDTILQLLTSIGHPRHTGPRMFKSEGWTPEQYAENMSLLYSEITTSTRADTWQTGVAARIAFWTQLGKYHEIHAHPTPDTADPLRVYHHADYAAWALWQDAMTVGHEPIWDQLRYDAEHRCWIVCDWKTTGLWTQVDEKVGDAEFRRVFNIALNDLYVKLRAEYKVGDEDDESPPKRGWAIMMNRFRNLLLAPSNYKKFAVAAMDFDVMQTNADQMNAIPYIRAYANGTLVTSPNVPNTTMGGQIIKNPELMVTTGSHVNFPFNDGERITPNITRGAVKHLMDQYGPNPTPINECINADAEVDDLIQYVKSKCPTYMSLITHAMPKDDGSQDAFLRLYGAAIFGSNHKLVPVFLGEANTGKSVSLGWLDYLLHPSAIANLSMDAIADKNTKQDVGFWPLLNTSVARVASEVASTGGWLLVDRLKSISNGGQVTMTVSGKYMKPRTCRFGGMLFLNGNSMPPIDNVDQGMLNRMVGVPFTNPFPLDDRTDYSTLYRQEASMFSYLLFLHYVMVQAAGGGVQGINIPPSWKKYTREIAEDANAFAEIEKIIRKPKGEDEYELIKGTVLTAAMRLLAKDAGVRNRSAGQWSTAITRIVGAPIKARIEGTPASARKFVFVGSDTVDRAMFDAAVYKAVLTMEDTR